MIKTITLTPGEVNSVEFSQRYPYFYIKNFSTSDVYASVKKFIFVADEDEVTKIPAGTTGIVYGTLASEYVNILCENSAKIEVIGAFESNINFNRKIIVGGEGGSGGAVDAYSKSEVNTMLSEKADNSDLKAVAKTGSYNDLTDKPEIPVVDVDKNYVDNALSDKVDKKFGYSLVSDTEITRLAEVKNYDDTQIKNDIALNTSSIGMSRKNLLKPVSSITRAGITYTVNEDGSVSLTGKSTATGTYNFFSIPITFKAGKYKVNGMPEDSSNSTYRVDIRANESGGTPYGYGFSEFEVEFTETTTAYYMIYVSASYTESLDGVTFYPMVRYADIIDSTYEPYQDDIQTQINNILSRLTALEG